jgi:hypothetical protein
MVRAAGGEGRLGGSDHLGRIVGGRKANRGFRARRLGNWIRRCSAYTRTRTTRPTSYRAKMAASRSRSLHRLYLARVTTCR